MRASPLDPAGDVSVVVVAYRTPGRLAECLESFEIHRPPRVRELIVVDNGALPEQEPPTARFPWIRYERNETNVHFRRGVNQGVRLATCRYVMLLNPDTRLLAGDTIARLAEVLDERREIGLVGPRLHGADGLDAPQGESQAGIAFLLLYKLHVRSLWPGNPLTGRIVRHRSDTGPAETVSGSAVLCRREEFLAAGGLDERARAYWEEQELARKLRRSGLGAYYLADVALFHAWRQGGTMLQSESESRRQFDEAMRLYYRLFYGIPGEALFDGLAALEAAARLLVRRRSKS